MRAQGHELASRNQQFRTVPQRDAAGFAHDRKHLLKSQPQPGTAQRGHKGLSYTDVRGNQMLRLPAERDAAPIPSFPLALQFPSFCRPCLTYSSLSPHTTVPLASTFHNPEAHLDHLDTAFFCCPKNDLR